MNKGTGIEIDNALMDKTNTVLINGCKWDGENPIVNVKEFEVTSRLLGVEKDITDDEILAWMRDANQVKILPLIAASNVYLLATLGALSKTLSTLIEGETKINKIKINFLIGCGLVEHSVTLINPIEKNYEPIILDYYKNNLTTVMKINFTELKSLLNILIANFKVKGEDLRKIVKYIKHTDVKDYCSVIVKINEESIDDINKWVSEKKEIERNYRVKEISFNKDYNLINMLIQIVKTLQQPTDNEPLSNFILIVPEFMRDNINMFFTKSGGNSTENELDKKRLSNIMFVSYTDPSNGEEDPEVIRKSIPSYFTILSKYINSNKIAYAMDEYYHSNLLYILNNRKFQCEKFHEGILLENHGIYKSDDLENLKKEFEKYKKSPSEIRKRKLNDELKNMDDKYIKKQKKELEVINDGFLAVQNDILEQLKLIL